MPGNTKITVCGIPSDAESFGDVLRQVADLDGLLMDDFLAVRGDIITNINIQDALRTHYHVKREEEKGENKNDDARKSNTIMTKLFMRQAQNSQLRDPFTDITMMVDVQSREIFKYQSYISELGKKPAKSMYLNPEWVAFTKSYGTP